MKRRERGEEQKEIEDFKRTERQLLEKKKDLGDLEEQKCLI